MKRSVLFDLDGTLLDTTEGVLESAVHAARAMGYPDLPRETMLKFIGPPIQESFRTFYGADAEHMQTAANVFREHYRTRALLKATPYPGLLSTLEELRRRGVAIGVATYKREDYALTLLRHAGIDAFCASMHGGDNFNRLTKADIVNLCIRELGRPPEETVLVGDTGHDAQGAMLAGIDFIGVTYGFGFKTKSDVDRYPNIGCAACLPDILEYIP